MLSFILPNKAVTLVGIITLALCAASTGVVADDNGVTIVDGRHYSNIFGETRNYRVFLPPGYSGNRDKRYPVIYFFHGWSQRYFGSSNPYGDFDKGDDNGGDNIENFVSSHDVIVVKADGYNRSPDEKYYVRPYNVTPVETYRQFPIYFPELVEHIDTHYRTIADRAHRAISGLSMGGFMTFWVGGKYPHLISAAGNFCGSPEFEVGPRDFPVEYRHMDMYRNYGGVNLRLHYGDKDFIRSYHQDLNKIWLQVTDNYSYKIFDAAHSTCGMGEMFRFILKTFESPPAKPERWHHTDVYPEFDVWGYKVMTDRTVPGFTTIENVDVRGFRSSVREFLPDGSLLPSVKVSVKTPPLYEKNRWYTVNDIDTRTLKSSQRSIKSDEHGSLVIHLDGSTHEIGINAKADKPNLVLASVNVQSGRWATTGEEVTLNLQIANKGLSDARNIRAILSATRPTVSISKGEVSFAEIPVNQTSTGSVSFLVKADTVEIERLKLTLRSDKKEEWVEYFEIPLRKHYPEITDFVLADGKFYTVAKSGNNTETIMLGKGNGDGVANPGESIVVLVSDQGKLWRTDLMGADPYINPFGISIRKSDNWASLDHVGGSAKYDIPLISSDCPQGHQLQFLAEYWLPESPMHIIKRGTVTFEVKGSDTTPPAMGRIMATGDNVLQVGLYDGAKISKVTATLIEENDPKKNLTANLADNGQNGDRAESDFIFSQKIPSQVFGIFRVVLEAEDQYGNKTVFEPEQRFVLH